MRLIAVKVE